MDQPMIPFPVTCPAESCGVELPLRDIKDISSDDALEKIRQSAIADLLERNPEQYRECFRPGCYQVSPPGGTWVLNPWNFLSLMAANFAF